MDEPELLGRASLLCRAAGSVAVGPNHEVCPSFVAPLPCLNDGMLRLTVRLLFPDLASPFDFGTA